MRTSTILALAAANIVAAQRNNGTNPDDGSGNAVNGFPGQLGEAFRLYGCVRSDNGFPTFRRVSMMPEMDLDFCAASCDSKYMGVQDTDCYCGDEIDESQSTRVDLNLCDIDCPGNEDQKCGGLLVLGKRQNVPSNVLLTVYVREGDAADTTTTVTETSTSTGTITSCPPEVTNCPIGSKTVEVATITSTFCPEATPDYKKIVCYGDECHAAATCDVCANHRVICKDGHCFIEECDTDDYDRLVICEGDKCEYATGQHGKVVCYGETCDIQECYGEECKEKIINHEACVGPKCPTPAPPAPTPAPVCFGPDCQVAPPKNNSTVPPVVAGADAVLPAAGAVFGIVAGFAALL
ncbi:hypothetical protein CC79DRAFT_1368876 [Sarocladium strictum]